MKANKDAYGKQLLAQYVGQTPTAEIIERDDNLLLVGSAYGLYFSEFEEWSDIERKAIERARGKILDIGCGAGRHSLYLQNKGFDVTGIDNSPGAIKVCKLRGLKRAIVRPIQEIDKFKENSFDTILMLGNNFGLFGDAETARKILEKMARITKPDARIIAGTRNPYSTTDKDHLAYHRFNRRRGRMAGQLRIRVRYRKTVGEWFDYLMVSPAEMREILKNTGWEIKELLDDGDANFVGIIGKKQ